jgi:hypothetical protein
MFSIDFHLYEVWVAVLRNPGIVYLFASLKTVNKYTVLELLSPELPDVR